MAKFFEDLKQLLTEMESFLVVSLMDTKMGTKVQEDRINLLTTLEHLREEHQQLKPDEKKKLNYSLDGNKVNFKGDKKETSATPTQVLDFSKIEPKHAGFLKKIKTDKKTGLMEKIIGAPKRWCVLHEDVLYITDGKTSKKPPKEIIDVSDCKAQLPPDDIKKEGSFMVCSDTTQVCSDTKEIMFEAGSAEEAQGWIQAIGPLLLDDLYELDPTTPGEAGNTIDDDDDDDDDNLYDEIDTNKNKLITPKKPPGTKQSAPDLPQRNQVPEVTTSDSDQETYDDVIAPDPVQEPVEDQDEIYDDIAQPDEVYDDTSALPVAKETVEEDEGEEYEDAESFRAPAVIPRAQDKPNRPVPPTPPEPTPAVHANSGVEHAQESPSGGVHPTKLYQCVWDCSADSQKELSFSRGDMLVVLSKKYDERGWWVARIGQTVGLVPKDYLSRAYSVA